MEMDQPLSQSKAQELHLAASEFNLAAILDAVQPRHAWEVACRTEGNLGSACAHRGLVVHSKSLSNGYDIDDINKRDHVNRMLREAWQHGPWKVWFSPSCVLPLAPETAGDAAKLRKKQANVRRQLGHIVEIATACRDNTNGTTHIYVDMPTVAAGTWRSSGIRALRALWFTKGQRCYWTTLGTRAVLRNDPSFHDRLHEPSGEADRNLTENTGYPKDGRAHRGVEGPVYEGPGQQRGAAHRGGSPADRGRHADQRGRAGKNGGDRLDEAAGPGIANQAAPGGRTSLRIGRPGTSWQSCLAMRLVMVELVWQGPMNESGTDSAHTLVETFAATWLQHRPKPEWILTDPQSSLAKGDFANFCGWIGCGLATTPGEAHWQNGAVEAVKAIKKTMRRLRNDNTELDAKLCGHVAAAARNQTESVKGFSPIQRAFGSNPAARRLELTCWRSTSARVRSQNSSGKCSDTGQRRRRSTGRSWPARRSPDYTTQPRAIIVDYRVGDWVCVWRNATLKARRQGTYRREPGGALHRTWPGGIARATCDARGACVSGWVLMGTSLWRCAPEQLRMASEQEKEGACLRYILNRNRQMRGRV